MCKVQVVSLQPQQANTDVELQMSAAERARESMELRKFRKELLLKNSILRRLGPTAQLNLNLHWTYLKRVMVYKEDLPPLEQ